VPANQSAVRKIAAAGGFCVWRRAPEFGLSGRRWKPQKQGQAIVGVAESWNFAMPGSKASWACARFRFEGWSKGRGRCSGLVLPTTCHRGSACANRCPQPPRASFRKPQGQEKTESTRAAQAKETKSFSRHKNQPARDVSSHLPTEGMRHPALQESGCRLVSIVSRQPSPIRPRV
jgi:hypothetical protein